MIDLDKIEAVAKESDLAANIHPQTVLELVSMICKRDIILKQVLEVFEEVAQWESDEDTLHPASQAIKAIKEVLK